jgi:hypothetical protein
MLKIKANHFLTYDCADIRRQKNAYQSSIGGWKVLKNWDGKPWLVVAENEQTALRWAANRSVPAYAVQFIRSVHTFANRRPETISGLVFVGDWYKSPFVTKYDFRSYLDAWMPDWTTKVLIQTIDYQSEKSVSEETIISVNTDSTHKHES